MSYEAGPSYNCNTPKRPAFAADSFIATPLLVS